MRPLGLAFTLAFAVALPVVALPVAALSVAAQPTDPHPDIDAFNRTFADATRHMDTETILALWEEDGVSLLPSTAPIKGKAAITRFMHDVMSSLAGAHMTKFESECFDIRQSGDWASEWCTEHQLVALPAGKPPFDGYGKMLLVLHRGADGKWRLHDEMWNQAVAPEAAAH